MMLGDPMHTIGILIGTRPEAIKLMPVIRAFEHIGVNPKVFVTGQHRELLEPILSELNIVHAENLRLMEDDQSLGDLSARVLARVQEVLRRHQLHLLVVQGDTTSAAMSALAGFYENVSVAHVEAGLRTGSRRNPFPEEMNRRLIACLADFHFAPTTQARENLLKEGVPSDRIHVVGNTVIDALFYVRDHLLDSMAPDPLLEPLPLLHKGARPSQAGVRVAQALLVLPAQAEPRPAVVDDPGPPVEQHRPLPLAQPDPPHY